MSKKRIEFIDLAKGVCILLVVIGHCGVPIDLCGTQCLRMPLYFILSGLFFKDYGGFFEFFVKKANKILIPFFFFYLTAYLIFYVVEALFPGLIRTEANGIFDVFTQRQYFNGPIWFLLCLFWANLMFCLISIYIKREYIRMAIVFTIGSIGILLGVNDIFLPLMLDVACTALPFFYIGYLLNKLPILYPNRLDKYNVIFAIIFFAIAYVLSYIFDSPYIGFHANHIVGNPIYIYIIAICSVLSILLMCKAIKHIPGIVYAGRYSIILLCTHHLVYRPVSLALSKSGINFMGFESYIVAILTIIICVAMIPVCIKVIPWFVAQRDLWKNPKSQLL